MEEREPLFPINLQCWISKRNPLFNECYGTWIYVSKSTLGMTQVMGLRQTEWNKCKRILYEGDFQDGGEIRWEDCLHLPQIPQKFICMWNNSYRTPAESWQKNADLKGKPISKEWNRAKGKKKRQRISGWGSVPLGGSHEGAKVSAHLETTLWVGSGGTLQPQRGT